MSSSAFDGNIVVIGAAAAGHEVAKSLLPKLPATKRIILIDPLPFAYWPIASLRASVVPGWEKKIYKPLNAQSLFGHLKVPGQAVFVNAKAVKLSQKWVEIDSEFEGSSRIPFEYLAIATGSSQPFPMRPRNEATLESIEADFQRMQKDIESAESVLIVGAGATGLELSGEIRNRYPNKKITVIHRGRSVLNDDIPTRLRSTLESKLQNNNVDLILNDSVADDVEFGKQQGTTTVRTQGGKTIEADYIFLTVGNKPNSGLVREVDPNAVEETGLVKVNKYMQVESGLFPSDNVYAVGDVAKGGGWRSLVQTEAEVGTVVANIDASIKTSAKPAYKVHKDGMRAMIVPFGPKDGSGFAKLPLLGDSVFPTFMATAAKSKHLFVGNFDGRFH